MAYIQRLYGNPEDDAKREKTNKQKLAILAVGDAIRNLGNIYHTTKYAPSQKFNEPVKEEYARQLNEDKLQLARRQKAIEMYQNYAKQQADLYYKSRDDERKQRAAVLAENEDKRKQGAAERAVEEHGKKMVKYDDEHQNTQARIGYVNKQTEYLGNKDKREESEASSRNWQRRQNVAQGWTRINDQRAHMQRQDRIAAQKAARAGGGSAGRGKDGKHRIVDSFGDVYAGAKGSMDKKDIAALYSHIKTYFKKESRAKTEDEMWAVIMRHTDDPYVKGVLRAKGYQYEYSIDPETGDPYDINDDNDDFGEKPAQKKKKKKK